MAYIIAYPDRNSAPVFVPDAELANARSIYPNLQVVSGGVSAPGLPVGMPTGGFLTPEQERALTLDPMAPILPGSQPLPPPGVVPGDVSTYPIAQAGFGLAAALPWIVSGGLALFDWFGGGGILDPGQAPPSAPGMPGVPLVGPGVPEPPNSMVKSRWETRVYDNQLGYVKMNFYALTDGRVAMYHNYKKYWKIWRPKKNIVLSSNPRLRDLRKFERVHNRFQKIMKKLVPSTRTTSRQAPSRYLSAVERKQLSGGS